MHASAKIADNARTGQAGLRAMPLMTTQRLVVLRESGLYCPPGDFYIDPWRPVARAVITHAHGDHARTGSDLYLTAAPGASVLRARLGDVALQSLAYGERLLVNDVAISLHPAGHVLGSAQVRLEHRGEVWVVSGDYKLEHDATCAPFETVKCDQFITEATFGLPVYRWLPTELVFEEINDWWRRNREEGKASVLFAYSLGKAQRIMSGIDASIGPIYTHGAVERLTQAYRRRGSICRRRCMPAASVIKKTLPARSLLLRRRPRPRPGFADSGPNRRHSLRGG